MTGNRHSIHEQSSPHTPSMPVQVATKPRKRPSQYIAGHNRLAPLEAMKQRRTLSRIRAFRRSRGRNNPLILPTVSELGPTPPTLNSPSPVHTLSHNTHSPQPSLFVLLGWFRQPPVVDASSVRSSLCRRVLGRFIYERPALAK